MEQHDQSCFRCFYFEVKMSHSSENSPYRARNIKLELEATTKNKEVSTEVTAIQVK